MRYSLCSQGRMVLAKRKDITLSRKKCQAALNTCKYTQQSEEEIKVDSAVGNNWAKMKIEIEFKTRSI